MKTGEAKNENIFAVKYLGNDFKFWLSTIIIFFVGMKAAETEFICWLEN